MLGALAIISAILIVMADREKRNNAPVPRTETETVTPGAPEPAPPPGPGAEPVKPSNWAGDWTGTGMQLNRIRFDEAVR